MKTGNMLFISAALALCLNCCLTLRTAAAAEVVAPADVNIDTDTDTDTDANVDIGVDADADALEYVKNAELYGYSGISVADIFENYPYCKSSTWKVQKHQYGKLVIFTCTIPLKFADSALLPSEVQQRLEGPPFNRTLRGEFAVSRDNRALALQYLDLGYAGIFPPKRRAAGAAAAKRRMTEQLLAKKEFSAPKLEEFIPGARSYFSTPEIREKVWTELARSLTDYARSLKVIFPAERRYWYYSKRSGSFGFVKLKDFAFGSADRDTLRGTLTATRTTTDLTPKVLAAHLKRLGRDPFLKDLLGYLNEAAPETPAPACQQTAVRPFTRQGRKSTAALLKILKHSRSTENKAQSLLDFNGPFFLRLEGEPALARLKPELKEVFIWQPPEEVVLRSYPDSANSSQTYHKIFSSHPRCSNPRWSTAFEGKTVAFSCELPLKFDRTLPPGLAAQITGPAFTLEFKAEFKTPDHPGKLLPAKLSLGSPGKLHLLPSPEKNAALKRLQAGEVPELKPDDLLRIAAYAPLRREFLHRVYAYFTSLEVTLPEARRHSWYSNSRVHYLKSVDSFEWTPPDEQGNFEGRIDVTIADTGLSSKEQFNWQQEETPPDVEEVEKTEEENHEKHNHNLKHKQEEEEEGEEKQKEKHHEMQEQASRPEVVPAAGSEPITDSRTSMPDSPDPKVQVTTSQRRYACKIREDFLKRWLRSLIAGKNAGRIRCEPHDQAPGQVLFFLECPAPEYQPVLKLANTSESLK